MVRSDRRRVLGGLLGAGAAAAAGPARARVERTDAIVIGSGAGGAMVALGLARAGRSVLVLERGRALTRADFAADEAHADVRRFRPDPAAHPHTFRRTAAERAVRSDAGWTAACLGGATVIYGGVSLRARAVDFGLRARLGAIGGATLADWPFGYAELAPFYDAAEALLDVAGDAAGNPHEPPRARPLPAPPVADAPAAQLLDEAARRLGLHPYRTPLAVRSRAAPGRAACTACGFCARGGCPTGAKSSAPEAIWPLAHATGRVRVVTEALATRIVLDARGRAAAVRYLDAAGAMREARADVVVAACGAVETARLLLLSAEPRHREGLGNHSGHLGRHVTFHHVVEVGAVLPEAAAPTRRAAPSLRAIDDHYLLPPAAGAPLGGVLLLGDPLGPIAYARAHPRPEAARAHPRHVRLFAIGQDLPRAENDVSLDPEVKDVFGLPAARITHENHAHDRAAARFLADRALELLAEARGEDRWADVPENTSGDAHQHGTCRAGDDPRAAVLDRDCAVHGIPNLFVADGGFMPTALGVNPALTIQANALRVAARIDARGRGRAL